MPRLWAWLGQALIYGIVALGLGAFSTRPAYLHFPPDKAQIVLSFSHVGDRVVPCRKPTREEIQEMAANMRRAEICERARLPLQVELLLEGEALYSASLVPTGLSRDGASQVHERFTVAPGRHELLVRLRDSARSSGYDYEAAAVVELRPRQSLVIDFRAELGGFLFGQDRDSRTQEKGRKP